MMLQTVEGIIDKQGHIQLLEPMIFRIAQRVLVTIPKKNWIADKKENPLKNSIVFEKDIVAPLDMSWDVEK